MSKYDEINIMDNSNPNKKGECCNFSFFIIMYKT